MTEDNERFKTQMQAARTVADAYGTALSALAKGPNVEDETLAHKIAIARERMEKYKIVYRELARR